MKVLACLFVFLCPVNRHTSLAKFSLVAFNDAFNTIRLYRSQRYVQIDVLPGNHKIKSSCPFYIVNTNCRGTQEKKSTVRVTNTYKEKIERTMVSKIEKKAAIPLCDPNTM